MDTEPTTPAARFHAKYGVKALAEWSKRSTARVYAWAWPRAKGGTGGAVPLDCRPGIIAGILRDRGETIAYADFEPVEGETYLDIAEPVT